MTNEASIRQIVDCILLNACSVNSSGLYNGKAGMALALFEAARYLKDEYIEEQAFDLLQEALVTKTKDISFEDGLGGIGYVLLSLMHNDFIDADFEDLFGEQHEKVLACLEELKKNSKIAPNTIRLIYYLTEVRRVFPANLKIKEFIKTIFETVEQNLVSQFSSFRNLNSSNNKIVVLTQFECYLKTVCKCNYADYLHSLINDYVELYREGRIKSSFSIAYYLEILGLNGAFDDVIISNKQFANQRNFLRHTGWRNLIEFAQLTGNDQIITENDMEESLLKHMPQGAFIAGYEQGLSRLLIYLTNHKANLL